LSLASVKSRLVLPFWYRLTRIVPDRGPLNGGVCVCVLQWGGALHPFISFCFKNYSDKVFKLVGVCAINGTSNGTNRDF